MAVFAVMLVSSGCTLGTMGRASNLSNITATPIQQTQAPNNELNQKMDAMIKGQQMQTETLKALTAAIINNKSEFVIDNNQAKKAPKGAFSGSQNTKSSATKESTVVKRQPTAASCEEINELKTRVAQLEDMHPDKGAKSVFFQSADTELSPEAKTWLEENIVERWFKGEIDITGINGYASKAKPKIQGMTNMAYAKQRAIDAKQYLVSRGVQMGGIKINIKGPTKRFGNNLNVTTVWDEILSSQEQEKKMEERKQYKTDPS